MVRHYLLAGTRLNTGRGQADPQRLSPRLGRLVARDKPCVSLHWLVCTISSLDGARLNAFLYFLSGFVRLSFVPLHHEIECVRLDDLLGQCCGEHVATGTPAPLRARVPTEA